MAKAKVSQAKELSARRPAETTTAVAAALAVLITAILGVDNTEILGALTIVIGFIPTLVTWIVSMRQSRKA